MYDANLPHIHGPLRELRQLEHDLYAQEILKAGHPNSVKYHKPVVDRGLLGFDDSFMIRAYQVIEGPDANQNTMIIAYPPNIVNKDPYPEIERLANSAWYFTVRYEAGKLVGASRRELKIKAKQWLCELKKRRKSLDRTDGFARMHIAEDYQNLFARVHPVRHFVNYKLRTIGDLVLMLGGIMSDLFAVESDSKPPYHTDYPGYN